MLKLAGEEAPWSASTVIDTLEELLAMAKRGEIVQLAAAYVEPNGVISNQFAAIPHQHQAMLLGAIDMMHAKIRQHMQERCAR